MKVLISNDDGIDSLGIQHLAAEFRKFADVTVVAPLREQSAVGHAITMKVPLRVIEYHKNDTFFGYAVDGTPADCVKMGVRNILRENPDIVVSGINHGSNTATNIIYSGTVSAAREAAIMDIPAIAVSVTDHHACHFEFAAELAAKYAKEIVNRGLTMGTLLNINVPNLPKNEVQGVLITRQGKSRWDDCYEKRTDPYGRDYFWLTGNLVEMDETPEFDQKAIQEKFASVTPIHFDLTDYVELERISGWKL